MGIWSLVVVLIIGGILSAISRNTDHSVDPNSTSFGTGGLLTWLILLISQVIFCIWGVLAQRSEARPLSKRRRRRTAVFTMTFGIGLLPILLFVFTMIWAQTDMTVSSLPTFLLFSSTIVVGAVAFLSVPFKILALIIFSGHRDLLPIVLARFMILFNIWFSMIAVSIALSAEWV